MKNTSFYVYCNGILGVKTSITKFKWVYGSNAPSVSETEYDRCKVKFEIDLVPEKKLTEIDRYDNKFQSYYWDNKKQTVFCRRTIFEKIHLGYDISINENVVKAKIGSNYQRIVRKRIMHLHDPYYLLSDLANILLLKNGFMTLYASAIKHSLSDKGVVCFAAPNTGKTLTATSLCKNNEYRLVGEDIVITNGKQLFSCPWTASYRKKGSAPDSSGSLGRVNKSNSFEFCEECKITDLVVLEAVDKDTISDKTETLHRISVLNGYLFNYCSSPIVKLLAYFSKEYHIEWYSRILMMLEQMVSENDCHIVGSSDPLKFSEKVQNIVLG